MRGRRFLLRLMSVVAVGAAFFPMLGGSADPVFQPLEKPAQRFRRNRENHRSRALESDPGGGARRDLMSERAPIR